MIKNSVLSDVTTCRFNGKSMIESDIMPTFENYSAEIQAALKKLHIEPGNRVEISIGNKKHIGAVMPRIGGDANALVIKLDNGYNIGIAFKPDVKITKLKEEQIEQSGKSSKESQSHKAKTGAITSNLQKPTIAILHTGGTIASRLDYRTGAVVPLSTADDMVGMYPELKEIGNIRTRIIFQIFSEDMEPSHWPVLAKEVYREITEEGCDGIIITHGTDVMHYTAAALAFMLRDLPVPVLLVGSQRSSDRPSSDAGMNLICAARFIAASNWSGVGVCMHASPNDDVCWILPATRCRKMHTSRRDAFRPIDAKPIANIHASLNTIEMIAKNYIEKDMKRIPKLDNVFDTDVALIKSRPGFRAEELEYYANTCQGIVIEGTGIAGNLPINAADDKTRHHTELLAKLKEMTKKGIAIYMTSQCIFGRINMNVYTTGRNLQSAGCRPAYMTPETAFVKLGWILGHTKDPKKVAEMMATDIAGEIYNRAEMDVFPDKGMEE